MSVSRCRGRVDGQRRPATLALVEIAAQGAGQLLIALHHAAAAFSTFGYEQYLSHEGIGWRAWSRVGGAVVPCAAVGVVFDLNDAEHTEVCMSVTVSFRDDCFVVEADATVDDPLPGFGLGGNQRFLVDLPDIETRILEECAAALHAYTTRLCSYTSVLDELGVPARHTR
jgi:hypothetical protein